MYWTLELASYLSDAPWPANKDELIDFAIRTGAPLEVVENLQAIEDEGEYMSQSMRFGPIIQPTTIIFGMRMSIKNFSFIIYSTKALFFLIFDVFDSKP